jgi:hypothetical protein
LLLELVGLKSYFIQSQHVQSCSGPSTHACAMFEEVKAFCLAHDFPIPNMSVSLPQYGRSRKGGRNNITQDHYYRIDTFYASIDSITT